MGANLVASTRRRSTSLGGNIGAVQLHPPRMRWDRSCPLRLHRSVYSPHQILKKSTTSPLSSASFPPPLPLPDSSPPDLRDHPPKVNAFQQMMKARINKPLVMAVTDTMEIQPGRAPRPQLPATQQIALKGLGCSIFS